MKKKIMALILASLMTVSLFGCGSKPDPTIVYNEDQADAASQSQAIEDMIALEPDAIIVDPTQAEVIATVLNKAADQGIIVVETDTVGQLDMVSASVGLDEYNAAYEQAKTMCGALNEGDRAVIVAGTITPSDDMTLACINALRQAGILDQVKVAGYGGFQIAVDAIKEGSMYMAVGMKPYQCGYQSVEIINDILTKDQYPEEEFIDVGAEMVTADNVDSWEGF